MTARQFSFLAIVLTVLFWGFSFVSTKVSLEVFPPMSLAAIRFAIAAIFLFIIKRINAPDERLCLEDLPLLAGAGLFGVTAYFFFENNGILLVSASEASIIIATIPIITMVAERLFVKGVQIRKRSWAGAGLSMAGVWLVAGASASVSGSAVGYLYMLGAAVSWTVYCLLTRPLFVKRSRTYIVFWQTMFGLLGFVPFALAELPSWGRLTVPVIFHIAYLGIFCSALAYWLYAHALKTLGIGLATIFVNLIPVVTVAAGFVFLGDRLAPLQWLGAVIVLAGVYLATFERSNSSARRSKSK